MASTPEVQASQFDTSVVSASDAVSIQVSMNDILAIYNIPAEQIDVSAQDLAFITTSDKVNAEVSYLDLTVIYRGKIDDPNVRAWTFTLDGHDFYVLRAGERETFVYDLSTGQWFVWGSGDSRIWEVYTGVNWVGGNSFASSQGSNIVVGSSLNGSIFILDPTKALDDSPVQGRQARPFTRRVTTQIPLRGYDRVAVYEMQLLGSHGDLLNESVTNIELRYSDNRGKSYVSAGIVNIQNDDFDARATWRSLGSFQAPGRMIQIVDTGSLQRIDSLTMNSDLNE